MSTNKTPESRSLLRNTSEELYNKLESLEGSPDRRHSEADNIGNEEFSTGDVMRQLKKDKYDSGILEATAENRNWRLLEDMLDKAVEQGYLSREIKEIETIYTEERVKIYSRNSYLGR